MNIKSFTTFDGIDLKYEIVNGNLSYKIDGTDWQDFILEDKRAYSKEEYAEFLSLFSHYDVVNNPKLWAELLLLKEENCHV